MSADIDNTYVMGTHHWNTHSAVECQFEQPDGSVSGIYLALVAQSDMPPLNANKIDDHYQFWFTTLSSPGENMGERFLVDLLNPEAFSLEPWGHHITIPELVALQFSALLQPQLSSH